MLLEDAADVPLFQKRVVGDQNEWQVRCVGGGATLAGRPWRQPHGAGNGRSVTSGNSTTSVCRHREECDVPARPTNGSDPPADGGFVRVLGSRLPSQVSRPLTTSPFTSSRGWFRWLYTIVSGLMPTVW